MNDNSDMDESPPPQPDAPQPVSPQRRLQELRSIPEKDRTDAQWDEMNELEIMLASSNRAGAPDPNLRREAGGQRNGQRPQQHSRGGGQPGGHRNNNQNRNRQNRGRR